MTKGLHIRGFESSDIPDIVRIANESKFWDSEGGRCSSLCGDLSEQQFLNLFMADPLFDPNLAIVAKSSGETIGFMQFIRKPNDTVGFLTQFFVKIRAQRKGVGSAMLDAGVGLLKGAGCEIVRCNGYAPIYIAPGVDQTNTAARALLEGHGFKPVSEAVAMGMELTGVPPFPDAVLDPGLQVRMMRASDTDALLSFIASHFPYWLDCAEGSFAAGNFCTAIALRGPEVVGFAQWQNTVTDPPDGALGRFGPFGVHPEIRSQGIGAAIFNELVRSVSEDGARYLWFGWGGGRNQSFYERAGCIVLKQFLLYERQL